MKWLCKLLKDDEGATMVEYAFMVMLIALVCVGAVTLIGPRVAAIFENAELLNALK